MQLRRAVRTQMRGNVHELVVDDGVVCARLYPFTDAEVEAASRIGQPVDRLAVRAEWRVRCQ